MNIADQNIINRLISDVNYYKNTLNRILDLLESQNKFNISIIKMLELDKIKRKSVLNNIPKLEDEDRNDN